MPYPLRILAAGSLIAFAAAGSRAELYVAAADGVAWTRWLIPPTFTPSITGGPSERRERIDRWEFCAGWRAQPWLAFEATVTGGGDAHNSSFGGIVTLIATAPGQPDPNFESVGRSAYRRQVEVLAAGPVLSVSLGQGLRLFTRQQIATARTTTRVVLRTYNGPVAREPPESQWSVTAFSEQTRDSVWQPAAGLEWRPPRARRWSFGAVGTWLDTPAETAATCLARVALSF